MLRPNICKDVPRATLKNLKSDLILLRKIRCACRWNDFGPCLKNRMKTFPLSSRKTHLPELNEDAAELKFYKLHLQSFYICFSTAQLSEKPFTFYVVSQKDNFNSHLENHSTLSELYHPEKNQSVSFKLFCCHFHLSQSGVCNCI